MGAETPVRRTMTARAAAERLGVSPRTVQRIAAEPRAEYEQRAKERRKQAWELKKQGKKHREIAEIMGTSLGNVGSLLHFAKKERQLR